MIPAAGDFAAHMRARIDAGRRRVAECYLDAAKYGSQSRWCTEQARAFAELGDTRQASYWTGQVAFWTALRVSAEQSAESEREHLAELERWASAPLPAPPRVPTLATYDEIAEAEGLVHLGFEHDHAPRTERETIPAEAVA